MDHFSNQWSLKMIMRTLKQPEMKYISRSKCLHQPGAFHDLLVMAEDSGTCNAYWMLFLSLFLLIYLCIYHWLFIIIIYIFTFLNTISLKDFISYPNWRRLQMVHHFLFYSNLRTALLFLRYTIWDSVASWKSWMQLSKISKNSLIKDKDNYRIGGWRGSI